MAQTSSVALALALLLVACSTDAAGPGTTPPPPPPGAKIVLTADTLTVPTLGTVVPVTAQVAGHTVAVSWRMLTEMRWLGEMSVLADSAVVAGRLVTAGFGAVTLEAWAPSAEPDTLHLRVAAARPVILQAGALQPGSPDTFRLRGYGLTSLTTGSVNGSPVTAVVRDSATALLLVPTADPLRCLGSVRMPYTLVGADIAQSAATLLRPRAGDLDLVVGEASRLGTDIGCLRLAPHPAAEYVLAYLDSYLVESGRTRPTEYQPTGSFSVSLTDASRTLAAPARAVALAPTPPTLQRPSDVVEHLELGLLATDDPQAFPLHPAAWQVGEVFDLATGDGWGVFRAQVMAVISDYLVVVFPEADSALYRTVFAPKLRYAGQKMIERGVPYLQRVLSPRRVVTNPQMNQLMIVVQPAAGFEGDARAYTAGTPFIGMRIGSEWTPEFVLAILAHEAAHVWQAAYVADVTAAALPMGNPQIWGVEGGADFARYEIVREVLGRAFTANWNWVAPAGDLEGQYADAVGSTGWIGAGYAAAAGMLRDFVARLIARGLTYDEAARDVFQGSLNGWYGCQTSFICSPVGLVHRMRARLGESWTAEDALLRYALSHAADDRTAAPEFQIPSFYAAYSFPSRPGLSAWNYTMPLVGGGGGLTIAATPSPATGSLQYFVIEDDNVGGSYVPASTKPLQWMILRIR